MRIASRRVPVEIIIRANIRDAAVGDHVRVYRQYVATDTSTGYGIVCLVRSEYVEACPVDDIFIRELRIDECLERRRQHRAQFCRKRMHRRPCRCYGLWADHRVVNRAESDRIGVRSIRGSVVEVVDVCRDIEFVEPPVDAKTVGLRVQAESAARTDTSAVAINWVVERHGGKGRRPALTEREPRVDGFSDPVWPAERIGTRKRVFEIVAPLVQDDMVIELLGVYVRVAEQE